MSHRYHFLPIPEVGYCECGDWVGPGQEAFLGHLQAEQRALRQALQATQEAARGKSPTGPMRACTQCGSIQLTEATTFGDVPIVQCLQCGSSWSPA